MLQGGAGWDGVAWAGVARAGVAWDGVEWDADLIMISACLLGSFPPDQGLGKLTDQTTRHSCWQRSTGHPAEDLPTPTVLHMHRNPKEIDQPTSLISNFT